MKKLGITFFIIMMSIFVCVGCSKRDKATPEANETQREHTDNDGHDHQGHEH